MLILTRRAGQKIMIAENIVVTVLSVKHGGEVRIGIEAPKDIIILRSELKPFERPKKIAGVD